jgi:hypothetical protein
MSSWEMPDWQKTGITSWKIMTTDAEGNYFGCFELKKNDYRQRARLWISSDSCSSTPIEMAELDQVVEWKMELKNEKNGYEFELHVIWEENAVIQKKNFNYSLVNIRKKMNEVGQKMPVMSEQKMYSSHVHLKPLSGVWILYPIEKIVASEVTWMETSNVCHEVDRECKTTREYTCQRCEGVVFEIFFPGCPTGGMKICSLASCGSRGQLACYRGRAYRELEPTYACDFFEESYFCQPELEAYCEGDRVYCR